MSGLFLVLLPLLICLTLILLAKRCTTVTVIIAILLIFSIAPPFLLLITCYVRELILPPFSASSTCNIGVEGFISLIYSFKFEIIFAVVFVIHALYLVWVSYKENNTQWVFKVQWKIMAIICSVGAIMIIVFHPSYKVFFAELFILPVHIWQMLE